MCAVLLYTNLMLASYTCHKYTQRPSIYVSGRHAIYSIHMKCSVHTCFWFNSIHHYLNGLERGETKEAEEKCLYDFDV